MDIQPIKNERDYNRALAEIESLWGAEEGTCSLVSATGAGFRTSSTGAGHSRWP